MNKWLLAVLLWAGLGGSVYAASNAPLAQTGDIAPIDYAGVSTCRINTSTGTTAVLCTGNPAIVYGVSASSVAATAYLTLYSTNSTVLSGAVARHLQYNDNNQADEDVTATQEYSWVRPVEFSQGLVIKSSAFGGGGDWQEWIVYYRLR